jgi:aryl-alcohol dehydrogenase-like predicted oxidoreductase
MGMSEFYGATDDAESIATIHRAIELGVTLLDTADVYGPLKNEELVGKAVKDRRDRVVVGHEVRNREGARPMTRGVSGRPDYVRSSCEGSLKRLGFETIDLYYQHRVDANVPIEDTVGAMAELVRRARYVPRSVRGLPGHDSPRPRRPSHHRAADRVLALEPRSGGRAPRHLPRARDRLRGLQPPGRGS